jgi:hypothetical protein
MQCDVLILLGFSFSIYADLEFIIMALVQWEYSKFLLLED